MSLHEREGQRDTQIHTYTYWHILRYMLNTRIEMIKMYFCYIYINISLYGESYMIRKDVFREMESYMSLLERERQRQRERERESYMSLLERERERQTERVRQTERERERERHADT